MASDNDIAVTVRDLGKTYRVYRGAASRLLEMVTRRPRHMDVQALDGINFDIRRGEAVGIIGRNGSGKSTLLRILAGIIDPTSGSFSLKGRPASILELSAGFIPGFSGVDNVFLNGRLMGMSEAEIKEKLGGILEFAGIGKYADLAVQTYSAGMLLRLGFAIAQSVDADVMLVDEILAVGDLSFQQKCIKRMNEFRASGATIMLVTHSIAALGGFCDRVIHIDNGRIVQDGPTEVVLREYLEQMKKQEADAGTPPLEITSPYRERTGDIVIKDVVFNGRGGEKTMNFKTGDPFTVKIFYSARKPVKNPLFRMQIYNSIGALVHGTNTYRHQMDLGNVEGEGVMEINYDSITLLEGRYHVTIGIYPDEYALALADRAHDVRHMGYTIEIASDRKQGAGVAFMPHVWKVSK